MTSHPSTLGGQSTDGYRLPLSLPPLPAISHPVFFTRVRSASLPSTSLLSSILDTRALLGVGLWLVRNPRAQYWVGDLGLGRCLEGAKQGRYRRPLFLFPFLVHCHITPVLASQPGLGVTNEVRYIEHIC